jgi:predicted glycoside hydrolase/deacetylase ChbG (UPF0249 family)
VRIILNADDFGYSDETVDATIECFERGGLTSATIMATMPAAARAIEYACKHPQFSFGVHLNYSRVGVEKPFLTRNEIPDLLDENGRFFPSRNVGRRALLRRLPVDQIALETEAQLSFVTSQGVRLSHVDSHSHLHKFTPFLKALQRVLPRFGLNRVRTVQDIYFRSQLRSPTYWLGPLWRRAVRRRFRTTDHLHLPYHLSLRGEDWWTGLLPKLSGDTVEIGVHPGRKESWREQERLGVLRFADLCRQAGHELIGWDRV